MLKGKSIVFTGTLEMKRADASAAAKACGASVKSTVSVSTNFLVAGPGSGKRVEEARAKGVDIWSEAQFIEAIGRDGEAKGSTSLKLSHAAASVKKTY